MNSKSSIFTHSQYESNLDLLFRTAGMIRDFLMSQIFHDTSAEELSEEWGINIRQTDNVLNSKTPLLGDVLSIVKAAGLDLGITLRDPGTGREVTLFAADNLSGESAVNQVTDEIVTYSEARTPADLGGKGLDGIDQIHKVDGSYTLDGNDDYDPPSGLCENCLQKQPLLDSLLCHDCTEEGIQCDDPEQEVEEGAVDVKARVVLGDRVPAFFVEGVTTPGDQESQTEEQHNADV